MNPPTPSHTRSVATLQEDLLQQALSVITALETGGANFFSHINSAIERPYPPAQALADYEQLAAQLDSVEAIISKLGLNEVVIPNDQPLEEILKKCSLASAEAFKSASSIAARATIVQKALSEQQQPPQPF